MKADIDVEGMDRVTLKAEVRKLRGLLAGRDELWRQTVHEVVSHVVEENAPRLEGLASEVGMSYLKAEARCRSLAASYVEEAAACVRLETEFAADEAIIRLRLKYEGLKQEVLGLLADVPFEDFDRRALSDEALCTFEQRWLPLKALREAVKSS